MSDEGTGKIMRLIFMMCMMYALIWAAIIGTAASIIFFLYKLFFGGPL